MELKSKKPFAGKLENERIKMVQEKSKVLDSLILEESMTIKRGGHLSVSPNVKRLNRIMKGNLTTR